MEVDLVVVDISLKSGNGLDLCKQLKARKPDAKMLVVSAHDESLFAERILHGEFAGRLGETSAAAAHIALPARLVDIDCAAARYCRTFSLSFTPGLLSSFEQASTP